MTTLNALYNAEGNELIDRIHASVGGNWKYLWQIATNRKRPSPEFAWKLMQADSRLTLEDLLFPAGKPGSPPVQASATEVA